MEIRAENLHWRIADKMMYELEFQRKIRMKTRGERYSRNRT